jgi:hypothetical protein
MDFYGFLWIFMDFLLIFYGFFMDFLLIFYGFLLILCSDIGPQNINNT